MDIFYLIFSTLSALVYSGYGLCQHLGSTKNLYIPRVVYVGYAVYGLFGFGAAHNLSTGLLFSCGDLEALG
jgi:hypothetical protein